MSHLQLNPFSIKFYEFTLQELSSYEVLFPSLQACTHAPQIPNCEDLLLVIYSFSSHRKEAMMHYGYFAPNCTELTLELIQIHSIPIPYMVALTADSQLASTKSAWKRGCKPY